MIGIGTWECKVDTMFFKGTAQVKIFDNNGEYGFDVIIPDFDVPDITVLSVEEDGNDIDAVVQTSLLPGKDINLSVSIDGDDITGFLKIPFVGKVKLKDGHRIA